MLQLVLQVDGKCFEYVDLMFGFVFVIYLFDVMCGQLLCVVCGVMGIYWMFDMLQDGVSVVVDVIELDVDVWFVFVYMLQFDMLWVLEL